MRVCTMYLLRDEDDGGEVESKQIIIPKLAYHSMNVL